MGNVEEPAVNLVNLVMRQNFKLNTGGRTDIRTFRAVVGAKNYTTFQARWANVTIGENHQSSSHRLTPVNF